jgi:tetratricopeptide (TPR) repeat protein
MDQSRPATWIIMKRQVLFTSEALSKEFPSRSKLESESTNVQLGGIESYARQASADVDGQHYQEAIDLYRLSVQIQPDNAYAWYGLGDALANLGRYEEALVTFDRAVALNPTYCEAWIFRGVALIHLERYQDALDSCDRAVAIQPHNQEAWTFRGVALQRLGRYKDAYSSYNKATQTQRKSIGQTIGQFFANFFSTGSDNPPSNGYNRSFSRPD